MVPAWGFTALPAAKREVAGLDAEPGMWEVGLSSQRDDALKSLTLCCDFPLPPKEKQCCP